MKSILTKVLLLLIALLSISACQGQRKEKETVSTKEVQQTKPAKPLSHFERFEQQFLEQPYQGIYEGEAPQKGLFPIRATGVSTAPIVAAAKTFLNALTAEQQQKTKFAYDDDEWRKWCNVDNGIYRRQGVSIKEMTATQKELAFGLLQKSLSAKGLTLTKNIMKTDQTLKELNQNSSDFDEELYFFTIMGDPSETEPWGWQLDGHHLVINYFILGEQVVMTPTFMGGEPIITTTGKYKGNTLFQDEQNLGLALMQSLPQSQQEKATLSTHKDRNNAKAEAFGDNIKLSYEGLKVSEISKEHQQQLLALVSQYVANMTEAHAEVKMSEVKEHLADTYFAWIGTTKEDAVFYYRIHSPVVLIEFDHQGSVGVRGNGRGATRNHIHTVVRTPNGNDYGKDLLRQHIERHH